MFLSGEFHTVGGSLSARLRAAAKMLARREADLGAGRYQPLFKEATGDIKQQTYWTHVDVSYDIICCWGWPLKTKLDIDQRNYIDILTEKAGDIDQQKNELNVETGEYAWNLSAHQTEGVHIHN